MVVWNRGRNDRPQKWHIIPRKMSVNLSTLRNRVLTLLPLTSQLHIRDAVFNYADSFSEFRLVFLPAGATTIQFLYLSDPRHQRNECTLEMKFEPNMPGPFSTLWPDRVTPDRAALLLWQNSDDYSHAERRVISLTPDDSCLSVTIASRASTRKSFRAWRHANGTLRVLAFSTPACEGVPSDTLELKPSKLQELAPDSNLTSTVDSLTYMVPCTVADLLIFAFDRVALPVDRALECSPTIDGFPRCRVFCGNLHPGYLDMVCEANGRWATADDSAISCAREVSSG